MLAFTGEPGADFGETDCTSKAARNGSVAYSERSRMTRDEEPGSKRSNSDIASMTTVWETIQCKIMTQTIVILTCTGVSESISALKSVELVYVRIPILLSAIDYHQDEAYEPFKISISRERRSRGHST